jgi:hypothetical protein
MEQVESFEVSPAMAAAMEEASAAFRQAGALRIPPEVESAFRQAGSLRVPPEVMSDVRIAESLQSSAWTSTASLLTESMRNPQWTENIIELTGLANTSSIAYLLSAAIEASPTGNRIAGLLRSTDIPVWEVAAAGLAETMQTPAWTEAAARLVESMKLPTWAERAAELAQSVRASQTLEQLSGWLADSMQTQDATQEAARLVELAGTSPWTQSMASLTTALQDPSWLRLFIESADTEIEPAEVDFADLAPETVDANPTARAIKQAGVFSAATYIVAALSLHLSNFLSTTNPVFDPHQFITDEWTAIAVALAVFGTLVMILTARNRP